MSNSKVKFTKSQQQAIDVRGGNILVSAAAGSGKTAVLTQRVISMLTGENPVSAERLVIVTYTIAAAIEMKQRIEAALAALIETDPENDLLLSQQLLLSKAKISTIHSLCNSLVKENFEQLSLPIGYRVAQTNEITALKSEVLEELLEELYSQKSEGFIDLADFFSAKDDRKITEVILSLYDFINAYPFPDACLDDFLEFYKTDKPFLQTKWGAVILEYLTPALEKALSMFISAKRLADSDEDVSLKYGEPLGCDIDAVKLIKKALDSHDWDSVCRAAAGYKKSRLGAVRGYEDKEFLEKIKSLRDSGSKLFAELQKKFFSINEADFHEDVEFLHDKMLTLFGITHTFESRFAQQKLDEGIIDFSDLEHFALRLLLTKTQDGYKKTPLALEVCEQYDEIMVDECQDLNLVQNLIFWAMSKASDKTSSNTDILLCDSKNLFLVGDVKQSIYRFRNAVPALFVKRKKLFNDYDSATHSANIPSKISLQNNFRSRTQVTNAVNAVFGEIMTESLGDINYDESESLVASATYFENPDAIAELHLVNAPSSKKAETDSTDFEDESKIDIEAEYIANLIENMVESGYPVASPAGSRPCTYRDFCILLRAKKSKTEHYANKLNAHKIGCYTESTSGYIGSFEISVMMDLLRIIDNPLLDISLFSVLLSPMFAFTVDELAEIKLQNRKSPLYINLQSLAHDGNQKCAEFLEIHGFLREQAVILPTDRLIQKIYDRTGFLFVVESMTSGEQKRANLRLLLSYAQSYEDIGCKGLDGFLRFVDRAVERGEDLSCANTVSERANVVRVMSIHGSKGLEFPICIVADCAKKFNMRDLMKTHIASADYGFGMKIRKPEELKEYSNLPLEAIKIAVKKESFSEEMRTLYVAMTRAKEKLIMVSTLENIGAEVGKILRTAEFAGNNLPFHLLSQPSYLAWLVISLQNDTALHSLIDEESDAQNTATGEHFKFILSDYSSKIAEEPAPTVFKSTPNEKIVSKLEQSFSFIYPFQALSDLPAKVTVTKIAKSKLDETSPSLEQLSLSDNTKLSGAARGTILHSFMQYADFKAANLDLNAEISRLNKADFLSDNEVKALNLTTITAFLHSDLCRRMMNAKNLYREYQFIYSIPALEVNPNIDQKFKDEKVLMQGIADTVFEEPDGIVIVDYKTDHLNSSSDFISKYASQLRIYRQAISEYFHKPVKESLIYSLHLQTPISV